MHVGQAAFDAVVVEAEAFVIEAQQVQDRGVQVVDRGDLLDGGVSEIVWSFRSGRPSGWLSLLQAECVAQQTSETTSI